MSNAAQLQLDGYHYHYPAVATIVTSHGDGQDNAMAVAWHMAVSRKPPIYAVAISPNRYTHGLIVASGEFVVNFVPWEKRDLLPKVAGCSGRDVDKYRAFGIVAARGQSVRAPVLAGAYAAYECRVIEQRVMGDHHLFVGSIVAVHRDKARLADRRTLDPDEAPPVLYLGGDNYASAKEMVFLDRAVLAQRAAR